MTNLHAEVDLKIVNRSSLAFLYDVHLWEDSSHLVLPSMEKIASYFSGVRAFFTQLSPEQMQVYLPGLPAFPAPSPPSVQLQVLPLLVDPMAFARTARAPLSTPGSFQVRLCVRVNTAVSSDTPHLLPSVADSLAALVTLREHLQGIVLPVLQEYSLALSGPEWLSSRLAGSSAKPLMTLVLHVQLAVTAIKGSATGISGAARTAVLNRLLQQQCHPFQIFVEFTHYNDVRVSEGNVFAVDPFAIAPRAICDTRLVSNQAAVGLNASASSEPSTTVKHVPEPPTTVDQYDLFFRLSPLFQYRAFLKDQDVESAEALLDLIGWFQQEPSALDAILEESSLTTPDAAELRARLLRPGLFQVISELRGILPGYTGARPRSVSDIGAVHSYFKEFNAPLCASWCLARGLISIAHLKQWKLTLAPHPGVLDDYLSIYDITNPFTSSCTKTTLTPLLCYH